ncbi:MAG: NmrA family NAD(P)-binding protein, partial [Calditrichaeota bacterium]|nr:NmrA family NAD(P)-binding protein [Calditrichota bacterium]
MKILLTGATGYIGKRLLPMLVSNGYEVYCIVRDAARFNLETAVSAKVSIAVGDLGDPHSFDNFPTDFDAAYYLVHSMTQSVEEFHELELQIAKNFADWVKSTSAKQIIYLGGIVNDENLSKHLKSRMAVEDVLKTSGVPVTILRAAIIIGSGSASFEIIRDLVEKLPVMIAPKWVNTRCQPIAIRDVLRLLQKVLLHPKALNRTFDIGGPDVLTYKQMMLSFANVRGYRRYIQTVPVLSPRLSSYWLYFVTSTSYKLARSLVDSMKNEVVCRDNSIRAIDDQPTIA